MNIEMNEGDTIYASRSGLVSFDEMKMIMTGYKQSKKENYDISVMHKDCTFATYGIVKKSFVKDGDYVVAGMPIGLAKGNIFLNLFYYEPFVTIDKETNKIEYKINLIMFH